MKATPRQYRSPRRAAQARATREAILVAAGQRFAEAGYAGTTMQSIAAAAGVAVESVYGLAGKAQLLKLAFERAIAGDDEPLALNERDEFVRAMRSTGQRELIRGVSAYGTGVYLRGVRIARTFLEASSGDPALREHWAQLERDRFTDARALVARVAELGPLRSGATVESAALTVWATTNWFTVLCLCDEIGTDPAAHAAWLTDTLTALLLPGQ